MSHYSRVLKVVIDVSPDLHDQELAFWQDALGQELPGIYSAEYHGAFLGSLNDENAQRWE